MTLRTHLQGAMRTHIVHNNGLITAPDTLIELQLGAIKKWLIAHGRAYEAEELYAESLAIRDLANLSTEE